VGLEDLATFMREGTPSGLSTISTGVPSGRNGSSCSGRVCEITPLLPCRPAILSPTWSLRFMAMNTLTCFDHSRGKLVALAQQLDPLLV